MKGLDIHTGIQDSELLSNLPFIQDPLHNFTSIGCSPEHFPEARKRPAVRGDAPFTRGIPHATSRRWMPRPHQWEHGLHGPTTHLKHIHILFACLSPLREFAHELGVL